MTSRPAEHGEGSNATAAVPATLPRTAVRAQAGPAARPEGTWAWWLATVSLVLGANVMFSRTLAVDTFYDLYAGRYIVRHGIPHQNMVTVAAHGLPWIDQQWLAQAVYYGAWTAGGYRAVAILSAALVTSGFAVLALLLMRRGVPPTRMLAWTAAAFLASMGNTAVRAQSFGYAFFALTLWLILADDTADWPSAGRLRARTWLLVPVLVLWANTHGSVLLGAGLVVLYAGYRAVRALARREHGTIPAYLALGIASGASVICTPYGTGTIRYYGRFIGNPELTRNLVEWAPPNPRNPACWAFFALLLVVAVAIMVAWHRGTRPNPFLVGLMLALLAFALTAIRDQAWFGFGGSLLAADTLARSGAGRVPVLGKEFRRIVTGLLSGLAVASLVRLTTTTDRTFEGQIPVRAIGSVAAFAARNPTVNVLGDEFTATPLLWLHPAMLGRVGFDVRFEQYSQRELAAYLAFLFARGPGWQRVMHGYGIIVVSHWHPRLVPALRRLPGWRVAYQSAHAIVLVRRQPRSQTSTLTP